MPLLVQDAMSTRSKIEYLGDWPPDIRAAVEPHIQALEWLIPGWCGTVPVRWEAILEGDTDAACSTHINYEYRFATVYVHGRWMNGNESERRHDLTHEMLHIFLNPAMLFAENTIARLLDEEPKFKDTVIREMRAKLEGAVQDLTNALDGREGGRGRP